MEVWKYMESSCLYDILRELLQVLKICYPDNDELLANIYC